jgi:hypothetical protein
MSFDYRFKGRDYALVNDQVDCKLVNAATTTLYEASSCDDLTKAKKWQCFATDAFTMYKDHSYTLSFEHKESRWAGLRLMTCFDIDNIRICKVSGIPDGVVVPAPAGMILSLLGTAMVGFLGKRRLVG